MNKAEVAAVETKHAAESTEQVDSAPASSEHSESASLEDQTNDYDQTEKFSEETLEATKEMAVQFVTAFHTYTADEPMKYLEDSKPFVTDALL